MPKSAGQWNTSPGGTVGSAQRSRATSLTAALDRTVTVAGNEKVKPFCGKASVRITLSRTTRFTTSQTCGPDVEPPATPVSDGPDDVPGGCCPDPAMPLAVAAIAAMIVTVPRRSEAAAR